MAIIQLGAVFRQAGHSISTDPKQFDFVPQCLRICRNLVYRETFSCRVQQTKFFEDWLRIHQVVGHSKWLNAMVNEP